MDLQSDHWSLRIKLKHQRSMNVVDDEQPTRNVVTCNKNNQYDHMTGMNNCFEELPS